MNIQSLDMKRAAGLDRPLAPSLEHRRLFLQALLFITDAIILVAGFVVAGFVFSGIQADRLTLMEAHLLLPLFMTISVYNGAYAQRSLTDLRYASSRLAIALALSATLLSFIAFYTKSSVQFSRFIFTVGIFFGTVTMFLARKVMISCVRRLIGPNIINCLLIDDGGPPVALRHSFRLDARDVDLSPTLDDPFSMDRLGRYLRNMDRVVISCPADRQHKWASALKCTGIHCEIVSETAKRIGAIGIQNYDLDGFTSLIISRGALGFRERVTKRLFDIVVSTFGLIILSPVFLLIAAAIRIEDGGPVLFRQRRFGRGNRFFSIYKFRSMRIEESDETGKRSVTRGDKRITRTGRFLRSTSIDELPQLFNILRGEMSIVGPRPHALESQAGNKLFWHVDRRYWQRHSLKPGLTGLAQIRGLRGATDSESDLTSRLQSDLEYINGWSVWRDTLILIRTLQVLVHDRAY